MLHTQFPGERRPPQHVIDELLALGIPQDDIDLGIITQNAQRRSGVPVLPLAVLVGAEAPALNYRAQVGSTAAHIMRAKPPARRSTGGRHITGNPVWAGSVQTGESEESEFVRPVTNDQSRRLRRACRLTLEKARELARLARAGNALSAEQSRLLDFTNSCHEIYLKMVDELVYRKGWCVPSYETVMRWTGLSRGTVYNALQTLRSLGLLDWTRRFIYSHSKEQGARSEQTSNLYRADLPQWLAKLLGLHAPPPDDAVTQRETALEEHALMLASAGKVERRRLMPTDPDTRAALIAAAARADRRLAAEGGGREFNEWLPPHMISIFDKSEKRSCPSRATSQP
ncbi:Helix-turn-helix domain-containing protein [Sphingobium faniae]|jgi:hypothetical protein|nr:helix-turn-helix domain-containing protein [Sphingobium yanoikuyae]SCW93591.1 Helix-turn-helix domain-containing protein [Sphingobium faniae]|tara:strand:- start:30 stop:1055 length:1026 start_codon:yes stop_codon:yes gene_type:complete